jgi:hypothetical protein
LKYSQKGVIVLGCNWHYIYSQSNNVDFKLIVANQPPPLIQTPPTITAAQAETFTTEQLDDIVREEGRRIYDLLNFTDSAFERQSIAIRELKNRRDREIAQAVERGRRQGWREMEQIVEEV